VKKPAVPGKNQKNPNQFFTIQKNSPDGQPRYSMKIFLTLPLLVCSLIAACAAPTPQETPAQPRAVGSDRDAHGCIGSAGYSWCAREQACARPWELAAEKKFESNPEAFTHYCTPNAR